MQNIRNKETILRLYDHLLPKLAERINREIAPLVPMFHDFHLERVVDTWTKEPDVYYHEPISIENGNVQYLGLRLRLEGFLRPGVAPFDLSRELVLKLDRSSYGLGPDKNNIWQQRDYDQAWTSAELDEVVERWCAELIEDLTQRLEQLT